MVRSYSILSRLVYFKRFPILFLPLFTQKFSMIYFKFEFLHSFIWNHLTNDLKVLIFTFYLLKLRFFILVILIVFFPYCSKVLFFPAMVPLNYYLPESRSRVLIPLICFPQAFLRLS
jgi:hypothetical protein